MLFLPFAPVVSTADATVRVVCTHTHTEGNIIAVGLVIGIVDAAVVLVAATQCLATRCSCHRYASSTGI